MRFWDSSAVVPLLVAQAGSAQVDRWLGDDGEIAVWTLTPIEVKWTENPGLKDARHLLTFMDEHPKLAKQGFIVCRCSRPRQLHDRITALPWSCL